MRPSFLSRPFLYMDHRSNLIACWHLTDLVARRRWLQAFSTEPRRPRRSVINFTLRQSTPLNWPNFARSTSLQQIGQQMDEKRQATYDFASYYQRALTSSFSDRVSRFWAGVRDAQVHIQEVREEALRIRKVRRPALISEGTLTYLPASCFLRTRSSPPSTVVAPPSSSRGWASSESRASTTPRAALLERPDSDSLSSCSILSSRSIPTRPTSGGAKIYRGRRRRRRRSPFLSARGTPLPRVGGWLSILHLSHVPSLTVVPPWQRR